MPKKILILAETGFIIRNLLLGKFPFELSQDIQIVAAVPNPKDPLLQKLGIANIEFIEFPREPEESVGNYSAFKRLFNFPHIVYRVLENEKNNSTRRIQSYLYDSLKSKWYVWGVALLRNLGSTLRFLKLISLFESICLGYVKKSIYYKNWSIQLRHRAPDMVVSTMLTHVGMYRISSDLPVVLAAIDLKIPVGVVVQSWDNITSKPFVAPKLITRWWTWSATMNKELLSFHPNVQPDKLKVIGGLQFDYHNESLIEKRNKYLKELGLNPKQPYLLFTPGTRKVLPYEDLTMINILKYLVDKKLPVQYVIRLHPKDYGKRWEKHQKFLQEHGIFLQKTNLDIPLDAGGISFPEEFYKNQINIISHAAIVINSGSTTAVDAAILDRPILNIGFGDKDDGAFPQDRMKTYLGSLHYKPIYNSGGVYLAYNYDDCYQSIKSALENPGALRPGREIIVKTITEKADGKAGKRLAEDIHNILGAEQKSLKTRAKDF